MPKVGMGAMSTRTHECYTIITVNADHTEILVQKDKSFRIDYDNKAETFRCIQNPNGIKEYYTLRRNGKWIRKGESTLFGTQVILGANECRRS